MKKQRINNIGMGLLFLLRQQRYLYHQLKDLAEVQQQGETANSPELMLEVINGRRKLGEKLREVTDKLQPIRSNWGSIRQRLGAEYRTKVLELEEEVRQIAEEIPAGTMPETVYPIYGDMDFDKLLVGVQQQ